MIGTNTRDRSTEFSFIHAFPALVLMFAIFVGGDWAADAKDEVDAARFDHGRAVMVALNGSNAAMELDFDDLAPTAGFVAPPPQLRKAALGDDLEGEGFDLEVRITDLDGQGTMRRVELRVGYDTASGERGSVAMATVRNDWKVSHADRRRDTNANGA